ncbi:CotY/CotZ family spore coat protein [Bacillus mojavensis]|uniref:CotY/CotZ family spore coat protein n=1 Tax=Bacillus mojavensis TaxID=72360 RepID=UPI002DB5BD29|nr:CotY/CotZ family spore coat protein [Bacillus mojavensis]MEC1289040.1 CotY/CotZ family spore coat protein [Bacillus mojavensis]MEC1704949.1 CotY/CotZ family spore coat protein [Bacillus mojavensis]MEC5247826.1 CotY/CotZ family spore coat protein [Bacillus mojavensis]
MKQKSVNCVCEAIENIDELQNAVKEDCPTGCDTKLLSPNHNLGDTVPFVLFTSKSKPFLAFGNIGGLDNGPCFNTIFFKVEKVNGCCATLSLLIAFNEQKEILDFAEKETVCELFRLEKTHYCIEVDLNHFCAIKCLNPRLINRNLG